MAIIRVWPVGANPVPKEDGITAFSPGGEDVENTPYVLRRIDFGELTVNDPMLSPPYVAPIPVDAVRTGVVSAALSLLAGPYSNATIQTIGQATAGDGNGKTFYWDATAADAEVVGSVYGVGAVGRWKQAGTITGGGSGGANPTTLSLTISASGTITDPGLAQAGVVLITATDPSLSIRGIRRTAGGVSGKTWSNIGTNAVTIEHDDAGAATTADRVLCPGSVDYVFAAGTSLTTQDDTVAARTRVASLRAATAASADSATLASYAQGITSDALAAEVGAAGQTVRTTGKAESGDGADGLWEWRAGSSATANGSLVVGASGSGRWHRIWDGHTFDARWSGVRNDGVVVSDLVVTGGSAAVTSASGRFRATDVGKPILVDTPSVPISGTVSITSGDPHIYGVGTNFIADVQDIPYTSPGRGWTLYVAGRRYVVNNFVSATIVQITETPSVSVPGGATAYAEQQLEATISAYTSPTQVTISATPVVSGTGVRAFWASDSSDELESAIEAANAFDACTLLIPAGYTGISRNLPFSGLTNLTIRGVGKFISVVKELRRASREIIYTDPDAAVFTIRASESVTLCDFALDGSVPNLGFTHTDGGMTNANGGRIGFMIADSVNCGYHEMGLGGFGSRDEYLTCQGDVPGFFCTDCVLPGTNNVGINVNTNDDMERCRITGNQVKSFYTALLMGSGNFVATSNILEAYPDLDVGTVVVGIDAGARGVFSGNTVRGQRSIYSGVPAVEFYNDGDGTIEISSNVFDNLYGLYSVAGVVGFHGGAKPRGVYRVENNVFRNVTSYGNGGKFIYVDSPHVKSVHVGPNTFWATSGSKMAIAVESSADTAVSAVTQSSDITRGPSVHIARVSGAEADVFAAFRNGSIFEASRYTVDGSTGNVARFVDALDDAHWLTQSTGATQVAVPSADAALNGALSASFIGAQHYTSNRAASAWTYLHSGQMFQLHVFVPTAVTGGAFFMLATTGTFTANGLAASMTWYQATGANLLIGNGASNVINRTETTTNTVGTGKVVGGQMSAGSALVRLGAALTAGTPVAQSNAPSSLDPTYAVRIGATNGTPANFTSMRWAASYFAPSIPTSGQLANISTYLTAKFGAI